MEGTIAEIRLFAADFAPKYWAFCNGQLMAIAQNQALFSLLGTTYGGNGQTTFALPNMQSRTPVGSGSGNGLSSYSLGEMTGVESKTITANHLPLHNHAVTGTLAMPTGSAPNTELPSGGYFANDGNPKYNTSNAGGTMKPANVNLFANSSGGFPVDNRMPYLAINHIICLYGIFPSRN